MSKLKAWLDKPGFPFGITNRDRLMAALYAASLTFLIMGGIVLAVVGLICLFVHR